MADEHDNVDLKGVFGMLRRRAVVIVFCLLLTTAAAFGFSEREHKKYTATASLVFNNNQQAEQVAGLQAVTVNNQQAQQSTNVKLVKLGDMAEKTAAQLGRGLTAKKVKEALEVSAQGESNIVDVAVTAGSPALAAAIANTYASQFVSEQQSSNHDYYASALALVNKELSALSPQQRSSPAGLALQGRAQSLGVLAELKNDSVKLAQSAIPPSGPSSPKTTRTTALGAVLGLLLGLGLALLLERLDRRVREPKDLEAIYRLPLLGVVPESKTLSLGAKRDAAGPLPSPEAEAFHLIRAHLRYFNVDKQLRTLMVVSPAPGDGKTTVARHLATAAAMMGSRALLVEVDLRRPTVAAQLGLSTGPGLADVLIGAVSLHDATQHVDVDQPSEQRQMRRTLDVLVSGAVLPPNPAELLESQSMEALLTQAKSVYDLIVIDTPPLTAVSDAFPLLGQADGVVVVGRLGRIRRDAAERLNDTLHSSGAPVLGVIANGFRSSDKGAYGYGYDYASAGRARAAAPSLNGSAPQPPAPVRS